MKKVAITLLSLLLCTQTHSFDNSLSLIGNTVYTAAKGCLVGRPALNDLHGAKKLYKDFHDPEKYQPACETAQQEINKIWTDNGIDITKVRIITSETEGTPLPCAVFDYRHYRLETIHLLLHSTTDEMFKYEHPKLMILRKAFAQHESQHVLYRDTAARAGLLWTSGIISFLAGSATQALVGGYLAPFPGAQSVAQLGAIFGMRELLLTTGKRALINAQEKRADLSIKDPEQVTAMIENVKREKTRSSQDPQWHVPYDTRIAYLEEHYKNLTLKQ